MLKETISRFKEKPKTKIGWRCLWLGIAAFFTPTLLGVFAAVIRPLADRAFGDRIGIPLGFTTAAFAVILSLFAVITSIRALKIGERSWLVWLGAAFSFLIGAFWIFMVAGELLFPH